jgi:hypothetical protein
MKKDVNWRGSRGWCDERVDGKGRREAVCERGGEREREEGERRRGVMMSVIKEKGVNGRRGWIGCWLKGKEERREQKRRGEAARRETERGDCHVWAAGALEEG